MTSGNAPGLSPSSAVIAEEPAGLHEIASDVGKRLQGRSPFFEEMEHAAFVATTNGRDVARCTAMINYPWQWDKNDGAGFIGYFAALRGAEEQVAELLTAAGSGWPSVARTAPSHTSTAPRSTLGTLTDAFDQSPMFPFPWQPPHYPAVLEANGYQPSYPFWIYHIDFSSQSYRTTAIRALSDQRCTMRPIDKMRWKPEVETLRTVFNDTFSSEWH